MRTCDATQFNEIAIATRGAYPVKLRDIGRAEDSVEESVTAARLNGDPSVTLIVSKQSGTNAVATAATPTTARPSRRGDTCRPAKARWRAAARPTASTISAPASTWA